MARTTTREAAPSAWLALIIAAMVLMVAAIGYVAFNQIAHPAPGREVRLEAPRLPITPPSLPDVPKLPRG